MAALTRSLVVTALASLASLTLSGCDALPFEHKVEQLLPCWPRCEDVVACVTDGECDDEDDCTQDTCRSGTCAHAPVDADGDGHGALLCGGDDCDDAVNSIHPGATEAPAGSVACGDGIDNDCDGAVDLVEQACLAGVCNEQDWCWVSPRPSGTWLFGVWMASANEIWAVGSAGTILRSDGVHFERTPSGTLTNVRAIWGAAADAIWAVGEDGLILHWDGTSWTPQESGTPLNDLHGVHGTSTTDVWAVGAGGIVLHWDGVSWSPVPSGTTETLWGAWAAAADDAWFAGEANTLLHWEGAAVQRFGCSSSASFMSIHGDAPDHVWAVGPGVTNVFCLWDGQAWSARAESQGARTVHGITTDAAWGFGLDGRMVRWDGTTWSLHFEAPFPTLEHLFAAWSVAENDVWAVGSNGEMIHWTGSSWQRVRPEVIEGANFSDVWGCAPDDLWIAGESALHFDGQALLGAGPDVDALRGFACDDIWGVSFTGMASHWDGSAWTSEPTGASGVDNIGGTSGDDLWIVADAEVWHRDATGWSLAFTAREPLRDVFALAVDDVWVVGLNGFTAHYDGGQWVDLAGPTLADLNALWASAPDDVWATGRAGTWRWDGAQWAAASGLPSEWAGIGIGPTSIDGRGPDDVWLVNESGLIGHWDGVTWTEHPVGIDATLTAVFAAPWGEVWVVGGSSTALRRGP